MAAPPESPERFDAVDWEQFSGSGRLRPRTKALLAALAALAGLYAYDYAVLDGRTATTHFLEQAPHLQEWDVQRLDWLLLLSLVVLAFGMLVPLALDRHRTAVYWRRLRSDPAGVLALVYVVGFVLVGLLVPFFVGAPEVNPSASYQPPVGFSVDNTVSYSCVGPVVDGRCRGTWRHPLGTTFGGKSVLAYTLLGTHVAAVLALVAATIIVPLAAAVGTTAAYVGGRVDGLLMRSVDVVQSIPPLFAYIVIRFVFAGESDMVLLVGVFGLLGWGSAARLVRSDALQEREKAYVRSAESVGASRLWVLRRHLLPNVSPTVLSTTAHQVSMLVLTEAALSYLELGAPHTTSWGTIIAEGVKGSLFGAFLQTWWVATVPMLALSVTVVAISVLGDALRAAIDPRQG